MVVLVLLNLVVVASAEITQLQWTDCSHNSPLKITSLSITPMPIELPGVLNLSIAGSLQRDIQRADVKMKLKRNTLFMDLSIPCVMNVGSCDYPDSCVLFTQMVQEDWAGTSAGIGQQILNMFHQYNITSLCPLRKEALSIDNFQITLPSVPSILSFFAEGDYTINISMTEKDSGTQVLCLDLKLSMKQGKHCTGWFGCGRPRKRATR